MAWAALSPYPRHAHVMRARARTYTLVLPLGNTPYPYPCYVYLRVPLTFNQFATDSVVLPPFDDGIRSLSLCICIVLPSAGSPAGTVMPLVYAIHNSFRRYYPYRPTDLVVIPPFDRRYRLCV